MSNPYYMSEQISLDQPSRVAHNSPSQYSHPSHPSHPSQYSQQQHQTPYTFAPQMQHPMANKHRVATSAFQLDLKEIFKRVVKYLFEGLAVGFVAYYFVGKGKLDIKDIVMLGITAAFVFAILDVFSPTVALGTRFGAGFGIGQGLFGVGPGMMAAPGMVAPPII